jgi:hypothetical protein
MSMIVGAGKYGESVEPRWAIINGLHLVESIFDDTVKALNIIAILGQKT